MALSSVRGTRATRKQTRGLPFRRVPLSCTVERRLPPPFRATPSDPRRPDSVSKLQDASGEQSASSVLSNELFGEASQSENPQDKGTLGVEDNEIDKESPFGEIETNPRTRVLVVKNPVMHSESGRVFKGRRVEQRTMMNVLISKRERNRMERDHSVLVDKKSKVILVKRPVMKPKEYDEIEAEAYAEKDLIDADKDDAEEVAWKSESIQGKREGRVLVVKRSVTEESSMKNEEMMSILDSTIEELPSASNIRLESETVEIVGRWWEDATVEKMEELEKLKELENKRDAMRSTTGKEEEMIIEQREKPKVIERRRPHSKKPTMMGRPKANNEASEAKSHVIVVKRSMPKMPTTIDLKTDENGNGLLNAQDVEESQGMMHAVNHKPKVIERARPKPIPIAYPPMSDTILDLRERVLVAKRQPPCLVTVPNDPEEFLKIDALKDETPMSVGDIGSSFSTSGKGMSFGGEPPMRKLGDTFQNFEDKGMTGTGSTNLMPMASGGPFEPTALNENANDINPEERESDMPSLTVPPRRTIMESMTSEEIITNLSSADVKATDEPMLPEEEEGMQIRAALLKDIQQRRQNDEDAFKKTDTVEEADNIQVTDSTSNDFQSRIIPEELANQETEKRNTDAMDPSADNEDMSIHTSLLMGTKEDSESDNTDVPANVNNGQSDGMTVMPMQSRSEMSPNGPTMDKMVDIAEETEADQDMTESASDLVSPEEKNEDVSVDALNQTEDGIVSPMSSEDPKKETSPKSAVQPLLKLQGPPKKPESMSNMAVEKIATITRPGISRSMHQKPSNWPSIQNTTKQEKRKVTEGRASKPLQPISRRDRPHSTTWQSTDGKTSPKSIRLLKARTPKNPSPLPKSAPALVRKPSKGEHSKPANMDLDRQIMKEKEETKRRENRAQVDEERTKALEWRQQKMTETRRRNPKKSDPTLIDRRRKARLERQQKRFESQEDTEGETIIEVGSEGISVEELGSLLAMEPAEVMKVLFMKGVMVTVNQTLDMDSVKVVAAEAGVDVVDKDDVSVTEMAAKRDSFMEEDDEDAVQRPPVVTVMGHVDHGKTTLLDYIRQTRVALGEAGGITQAIGAYTCTVEVEGNERTICFLDTPGHEAFSAMRARGTRVTDVAVVIVAADDGLRPQTREAIDHAKAADVPIVVAINKIDVPGADPERVKRELSEIEMLPEEWGGQTPVVLISAKTGEGVNALLEMLTLVADIQLNLRANADAAAKGTVIEAYLDKRSGTMATVLVQNGTLHVGDAIVAGAAFGKVRSLTDASGNQVTSAGPSVAVQLMGLHDLPLAGDIFAVCEDEVQARDEAEQVAEELRRRHLAETAGGGSMVTLSSLASVDDDDAVLLQRINLVLKADTVGSLEAARGALGKLPQDSVMIRYLHAAAGEVTESDVLLAAAAEGVIVGFNSSINEAVKAVAKQQNVELHSYAVIYDLIDDVRSIMEGKLRPAEDRLSIGQAEVRDIFSSGSQKVAGCMVNEGRLEKECFVRIIRKKAVQFEGTLNSLRRLKDKVETVEAGLECGVGCDGYSEWQEGDRIEAFTLVQKRATLEETHAVTAVDQEQLQQIIESSDDA